MDVVDYGRKRTLFIYLFIIGFMYRSHVLTPRSGRQERESGTTTTFGVLAAPQIVRLLSNAKSEA